MAVRRAEPRRGADLNGRDRLVAALAREGLAFAPMLWERLPALVHEQQADWWQDPTTAQRLMSDAAGLSGADAMFVLVAREAVRCAAASGARGDAALDALASMPEARRGIDLVRALHDVAPYGVIAAVPPPAALQRALGGEEPEAAEDAFTDLVSGYLEAGADAVAVTGNEKAEVSAGLARAARLGALYGRPVLAVCMGSGETSAWDEHGAPLDVISEAGEWPPLAFGLVITAIDVSAGWDAARLRAVGMARPAGLARR
jgi:hypothetical protein